MIATRSFLLASALAALAACTTTSVPAPAPGTATAPPTAAAPAASTVVPSGPAGQIQIVAGTYGPNCGASHGNVTEHLATACNGTPSCDYKVDYQVIGDPAVGCVKTYVAEWHCGEGSTVQSQTAPGEAGYGAVLALTCAVK